MINLPNIFLAYLSTLSAFVWQRREQSVDCSSLLIFCVEYLSHNKAKKMVSVGVLMRMPKNRIQKSQEALGYYEEVADRVSHFEIYGRAWGVSQVNKEERKYIYKKKITIIYYYYYYY